MPTIEQLYELYKKHPLICTDTRQIVTGCLFFALRGDHFNANEFTAEALKKGAKYVIIDDFNHKVNDNCIVVKNVLTTLQDLAKHHRSMLNIPIIGLTGSNGKTTTKELINSVLTTELKTFATKGNLNNHIGVPLSILSISKEIEIGVIEMGANHQQEIEFLCEIAQPTHGLISNIGMAHLDGFGGIEGVKKGKSELYKWLEKSKGTAFVNHDNEDLVTLAAKFPALKVVYYGKDSSIQGKLESSDPFLNLTWKDQLKSYFLRLQITGSYNFENTLSAICIGKYFNVLPENINKGLSEYSPNNNRSQIKQTLKNTVICDFYNANPSSMVAALDNLSKLNLPNKIAILGDMFELGPEGPVQHKRIIDLATRLQFKKLIFIGDNFYMHKNKQSLFFKKTAEALAYLIKNEISKSTVLLKGSRGMTLEKILETL